MASTNRRRNGSLLHQIRVIFDPTHRPLLVMIIIIVFLVLLTTGYQIYAAMYGPSIGKQKVYRSDDDLFNVAVTMPHNLYRAEVPEPGQPFTLALLDVETKPGMLYFATIEHPDWIEVVNAEGEIIQAPTEVYPTNPLPKFYLRLADPYRDDVPASATITLIVHSYSRTNIKFQKAFTIPVEPVIYAFMRVAARLICGGSPLLLTIAGLIMGWIWESERKDREEKNQARSKEKEDQNQAKRDALESIRREAEQDPFGAMRHFQEFLTQPGSVPADHLPGVLQDKLRSTRSALQERIPNLITQASNYYIDGNKKQCVDILKNLATFIENKDHSDALKGLATGIQRDSTPDDKEQEQIVRSTLSLLKGEYGQSAKDICNAVLNKAGRWNGNLLQTLLEEKETRDNTDLRSLLSNENLRGLADYIKEPSIVLSEQLPAAPAQDETILQPWLKILDFQSNPFYPFTPSVDRVLQPAVSDQSMVIYGENLLDRTEGIRAAVDYIHRSGRAVVIYLKAPARGVKRSEDSVDYLAAVCRGYADMWFQIITNNPAVFLYLNHGKQLTIAELLVWGLAPIKTLLLWLRQAGIEQTSEGADLLHQLQVLDGIVIPTEPDARRMRHWLTLRPPAIKRVFVFISSELQNDLEQEHAVGFARLAAEMSELDISTKIWVPMSGNLASFSLENSCLEWEEADLEKQLQIRFSLSQPGRDKTFDSFFNPYNPSIPEIESTTINTDHILKLVQAAQGSVTRMLQIGNGLLLQHARDHAVELALGTPPDSALYISNAEFNEFIDKLKNSHELSR
jgi:hypothetical protein